MINLTANTSNRIICYPQRNNRGIFTATTAYYGIAFENQMNQKQRTIIVEDISASSSVYQMFDITVTGETENLSGATVNLLPTGYWDYTLFPASASTLSSILTSTPLEYGVVLIHE